MVNGIVFYVLLFVTAQWQRLVPTSWTVFPDAVSVLIQYLSLNWPVENTWVAYNGLQLIAYFVTVFIAAPLALVTGLGMSPALSTRFKRLSKGLSIQSARSVHFLVLVYFLFFIVIHVSLVFATGLLVNLNHVYAGRTDHSWVGFWLFAASMVIVIVAWVAATPFTLRHPRVVQRVGQAIIGPLQHLFEHVDPKPGEYSETDISPYFWHNGQYPDSDEYKALFDGNFADWRLRVHGLVEHPVDLDLAQLRALPHHEQITQHFCIQGWSGVAKWGGVSMQTIVDLVKPHPEAKWVVFYSLGEGADKGMYYDAHPIEHMGHHLTMLAYDMNDEPLSLRPRGAAPAPQRDRTGLQASEMDQGHRVRRPLLRARQRLRRLQRGPRVLRLPPVDLTGAGTHQEGPPWSTTPHQVERQPAGARPAATPSTQSPSATDDDPLHRRVPHRSGRGLGRRAVLLPQPARSSPAAVPTAAVGARLARTRRACRRPHRLSPL